jgi:hypothetical protein
MSKTKMAINKRSFHLPGSIPLNCYWIALNYLHLFLVDEPSNSGNEDCLELRSEHSWTWNDESCGHDRPFICELHGNLDICKLDFTILYEQYDANGWPLVQTAFFQYDSAIVACHLPEHCVATTCTRSDDYQCTKCENEKATAQYSIYWPTSDKKVCQGIFYFSSLYLLFKLLPVNRSTNSCSTWYLPFRPKFTN